MTPLAPNKNTMKQNAPIKRKLVPARGQAPDIQRRINAGWLKLWRTVYSNTPPPTAPTRKAQGSGFKVRPPSAVPPPQSTLRSTATEDRRFNGSAPRRRRTSRLLPLHLARARAVRDRLRPPSAPQRRQDCHYAQASRGHRPDPCSG